MAVPRLCSVLTCRRIPGILSLRNGAIACEEARLFSTSNQAMDRCYTKKHEWVKVEGNKATVGISKYAADALGDIVYAQLPEIGDSVVAGKECAALESVKAAGEVFSPVTGKVTDKNTKVENGPILVNQSPEKDGWLFKLTLSKPEEVKPLMGRGDYDKYVASLSSD